MKSFTSAGVSHAALAAQFYTDIVPTLREGALKEINSLQSPVWKSVLGALHHGDAEERGSNPFSDDLQIILDETDARVRKELGETASLFFTAPTSFAVIYFDCHLKHSEAVKRDRMGAKAPRKLASFAEFDVEGELAWVAEEARKARELHFGLYEKFSQALVQRRFDGARSLLAALQATRESWPPPFHQEMAEWEINIACETGDVPMFVKGWNTLPKDATVNEQMLGFFIQKLFYSSLSHGVAISLNALGQTEAAGKGGYQAFCDAQATEFMKGFFIEIVAELLRGETHTEESFRDMLTTIARQKEDSFRSLNPYIATINLSWK